LRPQSSYVGKTIKESFPIDGQDQIEAVAIFRDDHTLLPHTNLKLVAGDRWTELTSTACWMIFLARPIIEDMPLPWQKPQQGLTPQRVQQSIRPIFALIGSPARPPKRRGKAPGWPHGRRRTPKKRYPVVKKHPIAAQTA